MKLTRREALACLGLATVAAVNGGASAFAEATSGTAAAGAFAQAAAGPHARFITGGIIRRT
jgi:hypothetical protein